MDGKDLDHDDHEDKNIRVTNIETFKFRGASTNPKKARSCPACEGKFDNVRRHVLCSLVPWYVPPLIACRAIWTNWGT